MQKKNVKKIRYKEHRPQRKLNTKWQEGRPWLQFNLEENLMTCSICMDYYRGKEMPINNLKGQNRFLSGCTNRKISAVTDYEKSSLHLKAVEVLNKKNKSVEESQSVRTLRSLKQADRDKSNILFRNAHAIIKTNRPLRDYNMLCQLDKAKGLELGETFIKMKKQLQNLFPYHSSPSWFHMTWVYEIRKQP